MFRYVLAALALKGFSCSPFTKRLYRSLGNTLGAKKRSSGPMPQSYLRRVNRMLRLNRRYSILRGGERLLEIGTGWLHWEALTCRLFFDVQGVLYDVWDNRQMSGLKNYITQLDGMLKNLDSEEPQLERAHRLIVEIQKAKEFRDLYRLLGFKYLVDPTGSLKQFEGASFNIVASAGVLEHIHANIASEFVDRIANILKPGGYSFHSINLQDHLFHYDRTVSVKQYLRYSERTWKRWFENDVQYINKIQRPDWLALFNKAGLDLVEEEVEIEDISGLKVAKAYQMYGKCDLRCCFLRLLHRKPQ